MDRRTRTNVVRNMNNRHSSSHHHHMAGNVTEGQGYADKRKRKILSAYKKMMSKQRTGLTADAKLGQAGDLRTGGSVATDTTEASSKQVNLQMENTHHYVKNQKDHRQTNRYNKKPNESKGVRRTKNSRQEKGNLNRYTETEQQRKKQQREHQEKLKEKNLRRESREKALSEYRQRKESRHKKLGKRTSRGQPIIKYQMDYLLQKIQSENM